METGELITQLNQLGREIDKFSSIGIDDIQVNQLRLRYEVFKNQFEQNLNTFKTDGSSNQTYSSDNTEINNANALVANVSHEIRTPLNGIIGFVDLLQETTLNPTQTEIVNALNSASTGLMNIINELLEYSKLAAGQEKFEKHPFNLKNLVGELRFLSETLIVGKDIKLDIEIDNSIPERLIGDPSRLSQILLNLLGNAIKFVDEGQIKLQARLKSTASNHVVLDFVVEDTGIGIAPDELDKIFNTYHQAPQKSDKYGGTGLGLSIVKQIVEQMGGAITVQSILGMGTSFHFDLPFETIDEIVKDATEVGLTNITTANLEGKRILVFEDNTLNQRLFKNQLENWGCHVTIVDNGIDGLQLLEKEQFDVLLMDLRMPVLNGFEISRKLRNNDLRGINSLPILAISADFTVTDKEKCDEVGIDDFLLKPYESKTLKKKITGLLKGNQTKIQKQLNHHATEEFGDLIDLEPLRKECLGQVVLLEELISLFKNNILEFIGETKVHLQSRNFQGVDFTCHKVKSCLGMVRASHLTEITSKMSKISKEGKNIEELNNLYKSFIELYPKIEDKLDLELNKLKLKA